MNEPELRANPYVGLRPFFVEDSLYFFGREQQTTELLDILRQHRFLGVVGSSGSGKSSLVRAGLLPALLGGFLVRDRDRWRTVQMKPGDAPIGNLAAGLFKAMEQTQTPEALAQLEREIRESHTDAVIEFLAARLESNVNLFLLVDQFEEIFAFRGLQDEDGEKNLDFARRKERARRKAEAADFVDLLLKLAEQRFLPIYVALTMRTDFLGDCDLFYGLPEALNRGRYLVPRMTREQLRDAVECPALLLGGEIAPRLLDHVLNELGDRFDRLPVLQHALLRTWDERQRGGGDGPVDLRHFELAGELEGALDQDAEAALKGFDVAITARLFRRLTDTDTSQRRVRSPARISELMAAANADRADVEKVVRGFEENNRSFVHMSADGVPEDPRVDISHESLIRQWGRLRNWVDEERRSRDEYHELVRKARKFEQRETGVLQDPELQVVLDWNEKSNPLPGWAQRYSVSDDDFNSAIGYLKKSVNHRSHQLADTEVHRRWETVWSRLILVIEVVAGVVLARMSGLLNRIASIGDVKVPGTRPELWSDIKKAFINVEFLATESPFILLFLASCVGLTFGLKLLHRRLVYPRILRNIVSSERKPKNVEPKHVAAPLEVALPQTYASTVRRTVGAAIDFGIVLLFGILLLIYVSWGGARFVMTKGSETMSVLSEQFEIPFEVSLTSSTPPLTVSLDGILVETMPDGGRKTYPIKPTIYEGPDSSSVYLPSVSYFSGVLSKGDKDWLLTLSESTQVSQSSRIEKGAIVKFPVPDPNAWELSHDYSGLVSKTVLTKGSEKIEGADEEFEIHQVVSEIQNVGTKPIVLSWAESVTRKMPDGEQKTYPLRPAVSEGQDASVVELPDLSSLTGTLLKADKEWSLTLSEGNYVFQSYKLDAGTIVRFPAPDANAWQVDYEFPPSGTAVFASFLLCLVFSWLYGALQIASRRQATLGMRLVGIHRGGLQGKRLTFAKASALFAYRILSTVFYGLGYLSQPFTKKRQTFHDWMAGSVVFRGRAPVSQES